MISGTQSFIYCNYITNAVFYTNLDLLQGREPLYSGATDFPAPAFRTPRQSMPFLGVNVSTPSSIRDLTPIGLDSNPHGLP